MSKEKTNIEHLRDIIETSNLSPKKYEEALEFMEAIETEITDLNDKVTTHQETNRELETKINELEDEDTRDDFEVIDCGYGTIEWRSDNLKLQTYMESLKDRIEAVGV